MVISDRLRAIREQKDPSQGDIEQRTGLERCYVSRVENGHTVPSIETLEKLARVSALPRINRASRRCERGESQTTFSARTRPRQQPCSGRI
jgi:transcriptional regulator with XRE-family HTH domain